MEYSFYQFLSLCQAAKLDKGKFWKSANLAFADYLLCPVKWFTWAHIFRRRGHVNLRRAREEGRWVGSRERGLYEATFDVVVPLPNCL